jgi:hypothetical protein
MGRTERVTSITACERLMAMSACPEPPREPSVLTATPKVGIGGWGDADDYEVVARYMSEREGLMARSAAVKSPLLHSCTSVVEDRAFHTVQSSTLKIPQKRPLEPLLVSSASTGSASPKPVVFKEFELNTARRASGRAGRAAASAVVHSRTAWRSDHDASGALTDVLPSLLPGRFFVRMDHGTFSKYRALSTDAAVRPELSARVDAAAAAAEPVTPEPTVVHHQSGSPRSPLSPLSPQPSVSFAPHLLREWSSSLEFSSSTRETSQPRRLSPAGASGSSRSCSSLSPFMWDRSERILSSSTTAAIGSSTCSASASASLAASRCARLHALPQLATPRVRAKLLPALEYRATLRSRPMRAAQPSLPIAAEPSLRRRLGPLSNVNVSSEYPAAARATKSDVLMSEIRSLRSKATACAYDPAVV